MLILLPILEIYVLIVIGGSIGPFNSILLILLTAIFGVYLLRNQGLKKIFEIRSNKEVPSPDATFISLGMMSTSKAKEIIRTKSWTWMKSLT